MQSPGGLCNNAYWPIVDGATWDYVWSGGGVNGTERWEIQEAVESAAGATFTLRIENVTDMGGTSKTGEEKRPYKCDSTGIYQQRNDGSWVLTLPPQSEIAPEATWPAGDGYSLKMYRFEQTAVEAGTCETAVFGSIPNGPGLDYYAMGVGLVHSWAEPGWNRGLVSYNLPGYSTAASQAQPQSAEPSVTIGAWVAGSDDQGNITINGSLQGGTGPMIFEWGDGSAATQSWFPADHSYSQSGSFTVTVTDLNGEGATTLGVAVSLAPRVKPPQITNVVLRYDNSTGPMIVWQDIYFVDPDGDSISVKYELIQATASNLRTRDGGINISSAQQASGAVSTGKWECGTRTYSVTLQATIVDRAGNISNPYQYTMECR